MTFFFVPEYVKLIFASKPFCISVSACKAFSSYLQMLAPYIIKPLFSRHLLTEGFVPSKAHPLPPSLSLMWFCFSFLHSNFGHWKLYYLFACFLFFFNFIFFNFTILYWFCHISGCMLVLCIIFSISSPGCNSNEIRCLGTLFFPILFLLHIQSLEWCLAHQKIICEMKEYFTLSFF